MEPQWEQILPIHGKCGLVPCAAPNVCFEPAHHSVPGNVLSMCLPPGLSPNSFPDFYYSVRTSTFEFGIFIVLFIGLLLGILLSMCALHIWHLRRRENGRRGGGDEGIARGGFGRATLARLRAREKKFLGLKGNFSFSGRSHPCQ